MYLIDFDFDVKILTALKGWVGHAPQGRGALHNYRLCALHIYKIYRPCALKHHIKSFLAA